MLSGRLDDSDTDRGYTRSILRSMPKYSSTLVRALAGEHHMPMPTNYSYAYRPEGWGTDIYPMPAFPQLVASDIAASSRWYPDVLGFADVFTMKLPNGAPAVV